MRRPIRQAILLAFQDWNENFKEHCKAGLRYVQTNKDYRANYPQETVQTHVEQYTRDKETGLVRSRIHYKASTFRRCNSSEKIYHFLRAAHDT